MEIRPIDGNALERDIREYADITNGCGHTELANGILKGMGRINYAKTLSLNTLRDAIYQDAVEHGLWEDENNVQGWPAECAAMIECETDELYDAAQEWEDSPVDNNEHFVEKLADVVIRCFSVAGKLGIDIDAAIRNKMEINKQRPWKHGKAGDV